MNEVSSADTNEFATRVADVKGYVEMLANECYGTPLGYISIGVMHGRQLTTYQALAIAQRYLSKIAQSTFRSDEEEMV